MGNNLTLLKAFSKPTFRAGSVILVTGASSGIGRELAVQYSKRDCKLMLVGRNETELENT